MRQFHKALRLLAFACLCLMLSGCPQPTTLPDGMNATEMVKKAVETRASLKSLTGRGEMKIADRDSDFSLSVKIEMAVQDPDHLRIRATKLADAIVAFDMLMVGKRAAFYVPTRKTLYQGDADNLKQGGVNFAPREVIARILHADRGLMDRQWKVRNKGKDSVFGPGELQLEQIHRSGDEYAVITVDTRRIVLNKVQHYNTKNELFFQEEYNGYKEIMTGQTTPSGNKIGSGVFLPSKFILSWPNKGRLVSVTLRDYDYDQPEKALADSWTIDDLDPNARIKDLNKINVESDRAAQDAAAANSGGSSQASAASPASTRASASEPAIAPVPASRSGGAVIAPVPASRSTTTDTPAGASSGSGTATGATGMRGRSVVDPF